MPLIPAAVAIKILIFVLDVERGLWEYDVAVDAALNPVPVPTATGPSDLCNPETEGTHRILPNGRAVTCHDFKWEWDEKPENEPVIEACAWVFSQHDLPEVLPEPHAEFLARFNRADLRTECRRWLDSRNR